MSLIDVMKEECVMLDKRTVPDGMGGFVPEWVDGAPFMAAIIKDNTLAARVAEKQGVTELYTITVDKGLELDFHDVIRRLSDDAIFRVTSNIDDSETPSVATFQIGQVTAERITRSQLNKGGG
jgi:hypothetical protein